MWDVLHGILDGVGAALGGAMWIAVGLLGVVVVIVLVLIVRNWVLDVPRRHRGNQGRTVLGRAVTSFWWRPLPLVAGLVVWVVGYNVDRGGPSEIVGPVLAGAGLLGIALGGRKQGVPSSPAELATWDDSEGDRDDAPEADGGSDSGD